MLLKSDKERKVYNTGITFKFGDADSKSECIYWAPELTFHIGERVRIRYNPEDRASILVYAATDQYICEAWLMGEEDSRYTISDVQKARSEFRHGLQERLKDYVEEIEREDHKRASSAEWEEARVVASEQEENPSHQATDEELVDELLLEDLIERFNLQDGAGRVAEEGGDHVTY
jgi:hypothetical protein